MSSSLTCSRPVSNSYQRLPAWAPTTSLVRRSRGISVRWPLPNPVRTLLVTVKVLPTTGATLVNNASVTSSTADPNGANNLSITTTQVIETICGSQNRGRHRRTILPARWSIRSPCSNRAGNAPDTRRPRVQEDQMPRRTFESSMCFRSTARRWSCNSSRPAAPTTAACTG